MDSGGAAGGPPAAERPAVAAAPSSAGAMDSAAAAASWKSAYRLSAVCTAGRGRRHGTGATRRRGGQQMLQVSALGVLEVLHTGVCWAAASQPRPSFGTKLKAARYLMLRTSRSAR